MLKHYHEYYTDTQGHVISALISVQSTSKAMLKIIMMEVTGKRGACIPEGLTKA